MTLLTGGCAGVCLSSGSRSRALLSNPTSALIFCGIKLRVEGLHRHQLQSPLAVGAFWLTLTHARARRSLVRAPKMCEWMWRGCSVLLHNPPPPPLNDNSYSRSCVCVGRGFLFGSPVIAGSRCQTNRARWSPELTVPVVNIR